MNLNERLPFVFFALLLIFDFAASVARNTKDREKFKGKDRKDEKKDEDDEDDDEPGIDKI